MDNVTCIRECPATAFPDENNNCQLCSGTCLMFSQSIYEANVTEDQLTGSFVLALAVSDSRTVLRPLGFTIISGNSDGYFSIDNTTGEVFTARELDRSQASSVMLLVQVTDVGINPTSAEAAVTSVTITVEDVNDSPPVFVSVPYITSIPENSPPDTLVFTVSSTDADIGTNALVAYTIIGDGHFTVHQLSGQISTTIVPIDFEMDKNFSLIIQATDGGRNPQTSTAEVFIQIVDRNDNRPIFVQTVYQFDLVETSTEGTLVSRVSATDEDTAEENTLIQYELVDDFNTFVIDNFTGIIRTSSLLDYETVQEYNLTVIASDGVTNTEPLGTATVTITIVDVNDNRPQFNMSSITAIVEESIPVGDVVLNVTAIDIDSGNNSVLYHTIVNTTALPFTISMEGVLTTEELLDRENVQIYNFMVLAIDRGEPAMTGSTSVTITLSDINDNEPVFMNNSIVVSYAESLDVGSIIAVPIATDRDIGVNSRITYSIISGNEEIRFSINSETGEISLQRTLDFETTEKFELRVVAQDGGTPSLNATANVTINIIDINDNSPIFSSLQNFTTEVSEVTEIGSVIFTAIAFDADSGINANISYSIVMGNTGNTFSIHPSAGNITLIRFLNFESIQKYELTIAATNPESINPLQGTTELIVHVIDVNEFPPRFLQANYEAIVLENQPASSNVTQVMATDPDNDNALEYQIIGGNSDSSFEIIPNTGLVVTTRPLDRENVNIYRLTIQVVDGGSPISFSASASLIVTVMDENDNAPLFNSASYSASVQEDSPVGTSISVFPTLTATDIDAGANAQITYSIVGESPFFIASQTGEISIRSEIDFENNSRYDVFVVATDSGSPMLSSTSLISISVININDNPPMIINVSESVTFVEGMMDGVLVTPNAVVIDLDNLPLSLMTMSLVDQNGNPVTFPDVLAIARIPNVQLMTTDSGKTLRVSGSFSPADASGMLKTLTFVNTENEPDDTARSVRITISDGTFISQAVQVRINIMLINDNVPILEINTGSQNYNTTFPEGSSSVRITGDVTIEDTDNNPIVSARITLIDSLDGSSEGFVLLTNFPSDMLIAINNLTSLTLEGSASVAIYERALENIAYFNSAEEPDASLTRTINITISDGRYFSETATTFVHIILINDPPHLDLGGNIDYETTFLEGSRAVRLSSPSFILFDNDNITLQSATISLLNPLDGSNEVLTVNTTGISTIIIRQLTHQIIITGVAGISTYSALLSGVQYVNTLANPTGGRRMVEFVVNDGLSNSTTAIAFVSFFLINNPPIVDLNGPEAGGNFTTTFLEGSDAINITYLEVIIRDMDSTAVSSGRVQLTNPVDGNLEGLSIRNSDTTLTLVFSEDNSSLLITGAGSGSLYSSIFQQLQYYNAAEEPSIGDRLITFIVNDGELNSSTVHSTIVVNQVNDPPRLIISSEPVFTTEFIEEGTAVRLVDLFAVGITDQDNTTMDRLTLGITGVLDGANEEIEYIDPSDDQSLTVQETRLQIGSKTFVFRFSNESQTISNFVFLLQTLQYSNTLLEPTAGQRLLELVISDGIDNSNIAVSSLSIVLFNDNDPEFDRFLYTASVLENAVGIIITTVTATDDDASTGLFASQGIIEYTISSGNDAGLFSIDRLTGNIIAEVASDRESESGTFGGSLFVAARNPNSTDIAFTTVLITIRDVNDNAPMFLNSPYVFEISELAEGGAPVGRVSAEDDDAGSNAEIRYSLSQTTSVPFFTIDQSNGQISVTSTAQLDYEQQPLHIVTVTASDRGRPTLTNSTLITIALADENDNSPLFEQATYTVTVSESAQPGDNTLRVAANDADFGGNETIFYSIVVSNNNFIPFTIDRENGNVIVNGSFDRETVDSYSFLVTATDTVGYSDTVNVTIVVKDSNDNIPTFLQTEYYFSVREDAMAELIIGSVTASDSDIGINADILYSITESVPFRVIPTSGVIMVIGGLDRETVSVYQFAVMANNTVGPADFDTANITINITDVNDNTPVFSEQVYMIEIQENFPQFVPFVIVMANDSDVGTNAVVAYQLLPSPNSGLFGINETTGGVYATGNINYETLTLYTISVTASDGMRSSQAVVNISVNDVNDNAPIFDAPLYSGSVTENTLSSNVIAVWATDRDSGSNSEIVYNIVSNEIDLPFSVNGTSGVVFLTRMLDREERDEYTFSVSANDRGLPSLSAVSSIRITVDDQNDNFPVFSQTTYTISLLEGAEAVGMLVFNVTAVDADLGSNSEVMYRITDGNERRNFFVDTSSGEVTVVAPLDAETMSSFQLTIEARDTGSPAQTSISLALIDILNVNDNVPTINIGITTVIFQEGNNSVIAAPFILVQDVDVDHLLLQANVTLLCPCDSEEEISSDIQGVGRVNNSRITISGPITDTNLTMILQSIQYRNTDPEPIIEDRVVVFTVYDGLEIATANVTIRINTINDNPPVIDLNTTDITSFDSQTTFIEGSQPILILGTAIAITDGDSDGESLQYINVTLTGSTDATEQITATSNGLVRVFVISSTMLQLLGPAAHADFINVLSSLSYHNTANNPGPPLQRVTEVVAYDGVYSTTAFGIITIEAVNDPPVLQLSNQLNHSTTFFEDGNPVSLITAAFILQDPDSVTLQLATVEILNPEQGEYLTVNPQDNVSIETNGVSLTINDPAPLDDYAAVLRSIRYFNDISNPMAGVRIVVFTVNDGESSTRAYAEVTIVLMNNPPTLDLNSGRNITEFVEAGPPVRIIPTSISITDEDSTYIHSATVTLVSIMDGDQERIEVSQQANLTFTYNTLTGQLVIQGQAMPNTYKEVLASISYRNIAEEPSNVDRQVEVTVSDGAATSSTILLFIHINLINDAPQIILNGEDLMVFTVFYLENTDPVPVANDLSAEITDVDNQFLSHLTIQLNGMLDGELEGLSFDNSTTLRIDDSSDVQSRTYNITYRDQLGSLDMYTELLRSIRYNNLALEPNAATNRTILFTVSDGLLTSPTAITTIAIQLTDDNQPLFVVKEYLASVEENSTAGTFVVQLTASDADLGDRFIYVLEFTNGFVVSSETGVVTTLRNFDREETEFYMLTAFLARPSSPNSLFDDEAVINITILDINDNSPAFLQDMYTVEILENTTINTIVFTASATDADAGSNGMVRYTINTKTNAFNINSTTGDIILTQTLDRENIRIHDIIIVGEDRGQPSRSNQAMLRVNVIDINDPPFFLQVSYNFSVSETLSVRSAIGPVIAFDQDSGVNSLLTYSIVTGNVDLTFAINESTGIVEIANPLNFSAVQQYTLIIMATDQGTPPLNATTSVIIRVISTDSTLPMFQQPLYQAEVFENVTTGTAVVQVMAIDPLTNQSDNLMYSFSDQTLTVFAIDSTTGVISVNGTLDRESQDTYQFEVIAEDTNNSARMAFVLVRVVILDANDFAPMFSQAAYNFFLEEETSPGVVVGTVTASDELDVGMNSVIMAYVITDQDVPFTINDSGRIISLSIADRENIDSFEFNVTALDAGIPVLSGSAVVRVTITDINDNPPLFDVHPAVMEVLENASIGHPIVILSAFDVDIGNNGAIQYRLSTNTTTFAINQLTGVLTLQQPLDYETVSQYNIIVMATDLGSPRLNSTLSVNITVVDVDDTAPMFLMSRYVFNISENASVPSETGVVSAMDVDSPVVTYAISGDDPSSEFSINEEGAILLVQSLDYERTTEYPLTVTASSSDYNGDLLSSTATVLIMVTDVNDNSPIFLNQPYIFTVLENATVDSPIGMITVTDHDSGINSLVTATIDSGAFYVSDFTVLTNTSLDREIKSIYIVQVTAEDSGMPSLSSSTNITIIIGDINDNAPTFLRDFLNVIVAENTTNGTVIFVASALDRDEGSNAVVTYSFALSSIFNISSTTGEVTLHGKLDAEVIPMYTVVVVASDGTLASNMTLQIQIINKDDSRVQFTEPSFVAGIEENSPTGSHVVQVVAEDPDETQDSSNIMYGLLDESMLPFEIDALSGLIRVSESIDREVTFDYTLTVTASNVPSFTATATVVIHILDVDDTSPEFSQSAYSFTVTEATSAPSLIGSVIAMDPDIGGFVVQYLLLPSDSPFIIDLFTGNIILESSLDFETRDQYSLTAFAIDGVGLNGSVPVLINVTDTNDNSPVFMNSSYEAVVEEDAPIGTMVVTVSATDEDSGSNSEIRYRLSSIPMHPFSINSTTGVVLVSEELTNVTQPLYELIVIATDGGTVPLSSTAILLIRVLISGRPPVFVRETYEASVSEAVDVGSIVLQVLAINQNTNGNIDILYLLEPNDTFTINRFTGSISTLQALDRESVSYYILTALAVDNSGDVPLQASVEVRITITDANDNSPQFTMDAYNVSILENITIRTAVLTVSASDNDIGNNGAITYAMIPNNSSSYFGINMSTGVIFVQQQINFEDFNTFDFTVRAQDGGLVGMSDTAIVTVDVIDVDDNPPVFSQTRYQVKYSEALPIGSIIIQLTATDADQLNNSVISYRLINNTTLFMIDTENGTIILQSPGLDYETDTRHILTVEAFNPFSDTFSATALVNITVTDENDNAPVFQQPSYQFNVTEGKPLHEIIGVVMATDDDLSAITYVTTSAIVDVGEDTGELRLTGTLDREAIDILSFEVIALDQGSPQMNGSAHVTIIVEDINDNIPEVIIDNSQFVYTEGSDSIGIGGGITVRDNDTFLLQMSTILLRGGNGFILITSQPASLNISGSDNTISLIGPATPNTYTMALRSLQFSASDRPEPEGGQRTISIILYDGQFNSSTGNITITVELINDNPPILDLSVSREGLDFSTTFVEEGIPVNVVSFDAMLSDLDVNGVIEYISIVLSGTLDGPMEMLQYTAADGGVFTETLTNHSITITGPGNAEDFLSALQSITYINTVDEPSQGVRNVTFKIFDGRNNNTEPIPITTITILQQNDPPEIRLSGVSQNVLVVYSEANDSVPITTSGFTITDDDNTILTSLTVMVQNYEQGIDRILYSNSTGLSFTAEIVAGELQLHVVGMATLENYTEVLGSLIYAISTDANQTFEDIGTPKTISVIVSDGMDSSEPAQATIVFSAINNPPLIMNSDFVATFVEESEPVLISPLITIQDIDSVNLTRITASIETILDTEMELLQIALNSPTVSVTYNSTSGILSLYGTATVEEYQNLLRDLSYVNADPEPTEGTRRIVFDISDGEAVGTGTVIVNVQQRNDPPVLNATDLRNEFVEDGGPVAFITAVTLADEDDDMFSRITITIAGAVDGTDEEIVVPSLTGVNSSVILVTPTTIQYEIFFEPRNLSTITNYMNLLEAITYNNTAQEPSTSTRSISITVSDEHNSSNIILASVTVSLINDNPPVFPIASDTIQVHENVPVIFTAAAFDEDADSEVTYSIENSTCDMISINSSTGHVFVTDILDYEVMEQCAAVIVATDGFYNATFILIVKITDENDNPPVFMQNNYTATVMESLPIGYSILTVNAMDDDSGNNSVIFYSIVATNLPFGINETSGIISTTGSLDFETNAFYTFTVEATDNGVPPLSSAIQVNVTVTDVNEMPPVFDNITPPVLIREDAPVNKTVLVLQANDPDGNSVVEFFIIGDNSSNSFILQTDTGNLILAKSLDRERNDTFQLDIAAVDTGLLPQLTATTQLTITVEDVNDNDPMFIQAIYNVSIPEDTSVSTIIVELTAYDADTGTNALLYYTIVSGNSDNRYGVNSDGDIFVQGVLDRETIEQYQLEVAVSNNVMITSGSTSDDFQSDIAVVNIIITDVNDNPPIFPVTSYGFSISENASIDTMVGMVSAVDADAEGNNEIDYQIQSNNFTVPFSIDIDGVITLADELDYELRQQYSFTVTAIDSGNLTGMATVSVEVDNINDNPPKFLGVDEFGVLNDTVPENTIVGTIVTTIRAMDRDNMDDPTQGLTYGILDSQDVFLIDAMSGEVRLNRSLDYENTTEYNITVFASDSGEISLTSTAVLLIFVEDHNEFSPVFTRDVYTVDIAEVRSPVIILTATDSDGGSASVVEYELLIDNSTFIINPTTGLVQSVVLLDRETVPSYTLTVRAYNPFGDIALQALATLNITVTDVNDNAPVFLQDEYSDSIPIGTPAGYPVIQVTAVDYDATSNAFIQYSIVNTSVPFSISENGSVFTTSFIDDLQTYSLLVLAIDGGNPQMDRSTIVTIRVLPAANFDFEIDGSGFLLADSFSSLQQFGFFINAAPGQRGTLSASILNMSASANYTSALPKAVRIARAVLLRNTVYVSSRIVTVVAQVTDEIGGTQCMPAMLLVRVVPDNLLLEITNQIFQVRSLITV